MVVVTGGVTAAVATTCDVGADVRAAAAVLMTERRASDICTADAEAAWLLTTGAAGENARSAADETRASMIVCERNVVAGS